MDRLGWLGLVIGTANVAAGVWGIIYWRTSGSRAGAPTAGFLRPQAWWHLAFGLVLLIGVLDGRVDPVWSAALEYARYALYAAMVVLAAWWIRAFRARPRPPARVASGKGAVPDPH